MLVDSRSWTIGRKNGRQVAASGNLSARESRSMSARRSIAATRRLQIIEATRRVVLRKGFHRVTTQDIAQEAGASAGIPHYYFTSLDAILFATLEHVAEEMRLYVVDEIARAATPRAKLEAYVYGESPRHELIRQGWLVW